MPNMDLKKTPIPEQEPMVRNKNFQEVSLGYTEEQARNEAARCLNCKNKPCVEGCPVNVRIPEFIAKINAGDYEGAYQVLTSTNSLPAVCGRVCPQESQCESKCVRGVKGEPVGIGRLERFAADWHMAHAADAKIDPMKKNGHKVAVVGSGPAGLTCAGDLAQKGFDVTVFESLHEAGGVLIYGIPEFRLPKAIVKKEVERLEQMGITVRRDVVIGRSITVDELFEEGFEAVFIGSGKVAVVGGGVGCAIAYPAAKALHNMGAKVDIIAGFRSKDIVILENEMRKVCDNYYLMTDDGTAGEKGFTTTKLKQLLETNGDYDLVIAIGPIIMMKLIVDTARPFGVPTTVSLNPIMIDGTGMCGCCRVTVDGKMRFACVEGPEFDGYAVDFDELIKRNSVYKERETYDKDHICNLTGGVRTHA